MLKSVLVLAATVLVSASPPSSTCGPKSPSPVPACDKVDFGSCGNACCAVDVSIPAGGDANITHTLYSTLKAYLTAKGEDKSFAYIHTADAAGHNPTDNLTPFPISWDYILQASHTTTGGYVDTVNVNFRKKGGNAVLRLFSISNIHGALGDGGQNYKTLDYLVSMALAEHGKLALKVVHGCGSTGLSY